MNQLAVMKRRPKPPMLLSEYQHAIERVKSLQSLAEGKQWSEKIEALAAWAKIYHDDELAAQARRLKLHALRRLHALYKELGSNGCAALREQGFTRTQIKAIQDVGRVKDKAFEDAASSDDPPTVSGIIAEHKAPSAALRTVKSLQHFASRVAPDEAAEMVDGATAAELPELIEWLEDLTSKPLSAGRVQEWSLEREERYRAMHAPDPEHVKILRAGIEEFRRMLENRWGS